MKIVVIFSLVFCLIIVTYLFVKGYKQQKLSICKENLEIYVKNRSDLTRKYYNCNAVCVVDVPYDNNLKTRVSQGLLNSAAIVCNAVKDLPSKPYFAFENPTNTTLPNYWIFVNQDWTDFDKLMKNKNTPSTILCQLKCTYNMLLSRFPNTNKTIHYTGFTSLNRFKDGVQKDFKKFLHNAGKSQAKGTEFVIQAWRQNPHWPTLTLIARPELLNYYKQLRIETIQNIEVISDHISEEDLIDIINSHGVHVCPSRFEGWGHYVYEGMSTGAIIVYTKSEIFSDILTDGVNGFAVNATQNGYAVFGDYCPSYDIDVDNLVTKINFILNSSQSDLEKISNNARSSFLLNDDEFKQQLVKLITNKPIPKIIHYMWIDKNTPYENVPLPDKNQKYLKTWKEHNPDYVFMYWSGKNILEIIKSHFPEYEQFYKSIKANISKCDFARFIIVYIFGGLYTDVDFYCVKPISQLLTCNSYFIFEPHEHSDQQGQEYQLFNGFFGAHKNNEFVLGWIRTIASLDPELLTAKNVMITAGPHGLTKYYNKTENQIFIGNYCAVLSRIVSQELSSECSSDDAFVYTLWKDGSNWGNEK